MKDGRTIGVVPLAPGPRQTVRMYRKLLQGTTTSIFTLLTYLLKIRLQEAYCYTGKKEETQKIDKEYYNTYKLHLGSRLTVVSNGIIRAPHSQSYCYLRLVGDTNDVMWEHEVRRLSDQSESVSAAEGRTGVHRYDDGQTPKDLIAFPRPTASVERL